MYDYYLSETGKEIPFRDKVLIKKKIDEKTKQGIRVILLAYKKNSYINKDSLIFTSILYIKDDIRKEAIEGVKSVTKCWYSNSNDYRR